LNPYGKIQETNESRDCDDQGNGQQPHNDGAKGKQQADGVKFDQPPALFFIVDDVERVHQGLHPLIGTPDGQENARDHAQA